MAAKKITLKDLASEVEKLSEMNQKKDDLIKALDDKMIILQNWAQENFSSICKKITEDSKLHLENAKILDQKVSDFNLKCVQSKNEQAIEKMEENNKNVNVNFKCRECSLRFGNKLSLKKHIADFHPKEVNCNLCDETFDQIWKLEQHMETHSAEKAFECTICDKKFLLQWRLKKHLKGHTVKNVRFCHFFNNNVKCIFEETSGCMFRHEAAPPCNNLEKCKYKKCQFSHTIYSDTEKNLSENSKNEEVQEETSNDDNECGKCAFCDEMVDHSKHNLRTCSNCDFTTKCWAEDNKHWNETPDHNFSAEELRKMGYKI